MKIHAEHVAEGDGAAGPGVAACKLHADRARELLLLAPAAPDQRRWVARLQRRVQRYGYRAAHTNHDHTKLSPRYMYTLLLLPPPDQRRWVAVMITGQFFPIAYLISELDYFCIISIII